MSGSVVHCMFSAYDVFIGRPGRWGNPFKIGADGTREQVIEKFRAWIMTQSELLADLHTLKGRRLGCYCKPAACHGDVLLELAERIGVLPAPTATGYRAALQEWRRSYFVELLTRCQGNNTEVARVSGLDRTSLYRVFSELGLNARDFRDTPGRS